MLRFKMGVYQNSSSQPNGERYQSPMSETAGDPDFEAGALYLMPEEGRRLGCPVPLAVQLGDLWDRAVEVNRSGSDT